jgi:hypothetical protein
MVTLKDGSAVEDARLDRIPFFDPRSRGYAVAEKLRAMPLRGKTWYYAGAPFKSRQNTDQGREGACVGFGWTNELIASPRAWKWNDHAAANRFARKVYHEAQKIDYWPGGSYEGASPVYEGSSVLAGAQVMQRDGYIEEYRWAFSIEEVCQAVAQLGPAVVGTDWTSDMEPRPSGLLEGSSGSAQGGHCYLLRGLILKPRIKGESKVGPVFVLTNSWGDDWGNGGDAYIKVEDFERLMKQQGEVCIPVGRK